MFDENKALKIRYIPIDCHLVDVHLRTWAVYSIVVIPFHTWPERVLRSKSGE